MLEARFVFKGVEFQVRATRPVFYFSHVNNPAIIESGTPMSHSWNVTMNVIAVGAPMGHERYHGGFFAPAITPGSVEQGADIARGMLAYWAETMRFCFGQVEEVAAGDFKRLLPPNFNFGWSNDFVHTEHLAQLEKRIRSNLSMSIVEYFSALCEELFQYKQRAFQLLGTAHWLLEPFGIFPSSQYGILHLRSETLLAYSAVVKSAEREAVVVRFDLNDKQLPLKTLRTQVTKRAKKLSVQLDDAIDVDQPELDDILSLLARLASYQQDNDGFITPLYDRDARCVTLGVRYQGYPYVLLGVTSGSSDISFELVFVSPLDYPRNAAQFAAMKEKYSLADNLKLAKPKE